MAKNVIGMIIAVAFAMMNVYTRNLACTPGFAGSALPGSRSTSISHNALCCWVIVLFCLGPILCHAEGFKRQPGYYYGQGTAATLEEASELARLDLIQEALWGDSVQASAIGVKQVAAFGLGNLKPFFKEKIPGGALNVACRIKLAVWDKAVEQRLNALRAELGPQLVIWDTASAGIGPRLRAAAGVLSRIDSEGLGGLLREAGPDSSLLSEKIEAGMLKLVRGLSLGLKPDGGFVDSSTVSEIIVLDSDGKSVVDLELDFLWKSCGPDPVAASAWDESPQRITLSGLTDSNGSLRIAYPSEPAFQDSSTRLSVLPRIAARPGSTALREAFASLEIQARYRHFSDKTAFFGRQMPIPGGSFMAGALAADKRATRKEATRSATVKPFSMDIYPVSNRLYAIFLEDSRATVFPEYWENPEFNQADQPVVGISWADANAFAAWLSGRLGQLWRLPSEDEWERAARGGKDLIYPWGNEAPSDGRRANYQGNGDFTRPSAVGSFESGKNAYGLYDMAGNVWQWTSTPSGSVTPGADAGTESTMTVKGGSWMDGPAELRVSNRRGLDPALGYFDVGFRLIREVNDE